MKTIMRKTAGIAATLVACFLAAVVVTRATINTAANNITIGCNGSLASFGFTFPAVARSDISVIVTNASGIATTLPTNQFTLTLNPAPAGQLWGLGGTVVYPTSGPPCPSGSLVTIQRTLPLSQGVSLSNQGSMFPSTVETALDLVTMQVQQVAATFGRAIIVAPSDPAPTPLPPAAQRANMALVFDGSGNPTAGAVPSSGVISSVMQPVVNAASLSDGRAAFGLGAMAVENIGRGLQDDGAGNARVVFAFNSVSTDQAIDSTYFLQKMVATGPLTLVLPLASTLWPGFGFWVDIYGTDITLTPDPSDTIVQTQASGVSLNMPIGNSAFIYTDAAAPGSWYIQWTTQSAITVAGFQTGDFKWRPTSEILSGFVRANTNTIGSALSGAIERANDDTVNLFIYLWNNCVEALCPVSGGRGVSGAADFTAGKTIVLPDMRGRTPFGLSAMGGLNSNRLANALFIVGNQLIPASAGGEDAHTLTTTEVPNLSVSVTGTPSGNVDITDTRVWTAPGNTTTGVAGGGVFPTNAQAQTENVNVPVTSGSIDGSFTGDPLTSTGATTDGGGALHSIMPPFKLGTWYIKL